MSILQCRPSSNVLMSINREGDNGNNHINIIIIIKLLSHDDNFASLGTCFQSDFRGFESRFGVLRWELSELRCTRQYSSISVFLPHFRRTGERGASFLPLHKFYINSRTRRYHCPTSATVPGTQLEQKSSSHGKQLWRLWPVLARAAPS